jgi:ketosteroid isomerase-like protein
VADQDSLKPSKADTVRVPGLLDQYRQQRRAWLAQADELVRMRDEVRMAAEQEALQIVTAARRDVRRIIVEARRELLVLTAQLHAAVEATDDPRLEAPTLAPLLAAPEDRSRFEAATGDSLDHTRDIVLGARKQVRSVLGEARAEIEALTSEGPGGLGQSDTDTATDPATDATDGTVTDGPTAGAAAAATASDIQSPRRDARIASLSGGAASRRHLDDDGPVNEGPVHELSVDPNLTALDFQSRDLPIPTLAGILGRADHTVSDRERVATGERTFDGPVFDSASLPPFGTPRLSELRDLLRDPLFDDRPHIHAFDVEAIEMSAAGLEPEAPAAFKGNVVAPELSKAQSAGDTNESAYEAAPDAAYAAADEAREASPLPEHAPQSTLDAQEFTPPSRLFMSDDSGARGQGRSARTFVGLFAATGALALLATGWWAFARDSAEPLSAATPPVIDSTGGADAAAAPTAAGAAAAPRDSLSLTIEARRTSWIRAQVDGKDEAGRIYEAGETRHIEGARTVSIRAGDAGGVFVGVDGAAGQALGPDGGPATKQFSVSSAAVAAPVAGTVGNSGIGPGTTAPATSSAAVSTTPPPAPAPAAAAPAAQSAAARRPDGPAPASGAQPSVAVASEAAPGGVDNTSAGRPDLVQAGQQWLDAYQRRDRDAMASSGTDNITVSDERSVTERFPAWQSTVRRDLDQVELELTGDTALLTARMTERTDGAQTAQHISRVSQIWVRRSGRWRLADVRIIGEARLNQIVR